VKYVKQLRKNQMLDDDILFSCSYKDLSYNSLVALTLWSSNKPFDELSPLGSTVLPLFDENFRLREGKLNLLIWPNVPPDTSFDSKVLNKNWKKLLLDTWIGPG
jgi:phosphatidylinositol 3-kinase